MLQNAGHMGLSSVLPLSSSRIGAFMVGPVCELVGSFESDQGASCVKEEADGICRYGCRLAVWRCVADGGARQSWAGLPNR